jgi:hypothetical protein
MGKIRRGGHIFVTWKVDHSPRHVHVYRDAAFIVKWDLDSRKPMKGNATRRVRVLIEQLESEGAL